MLKIHCHGTRDTSTWREGEPLPHGPAWVDLMEPTPAERSAVEALFGTPLPKRDEISGLGLSGRHHDDRRVLSLHARLYADDPHGVPAPLGMLVTKDQLLTLRYQSSHAFDQAIANLEHDDAQPGGSNMMVALFDAIANDIAEQMQRIAGDVAKLSDEVFRDTDEKTRELRRKLGRIGELEGRLARYRTSQLGMARAVGLVQHRAPDWIDADAMACVKVLANDLKILDQFDDQLTGKLAFLQDGVLGFINTAQNAVMKLLTVASVVTIPPVILAGVWGMNFRHMPELDKIWGYPMALSALVVSMLLPLLWFGRNGWLSRD